MAYLLALTIHLHFPESGSLKGKRKDLVSVRSVLAKRFGAAVAEVDHHDLWQRSTLAVALVSGSVTEVERNADGLERYLLGRFPDGIRIERHLLSFEDLSAG
jgi:uncharacterized protein YlxP (DUF503 family)